jgi:catechol 2,3-dioxygenase-like lactoylglutathione lyase family enzyme
VSIRSIDHVNIRAPAGDIARLRQFYCDVVGLSEGWRPGFESRGYWLYAGARPLVHLVEAEAGQPSNPVGGVDHISFRSDDLDGFVSRLRERGVQFQLSVVPTLNQRQLLIRDPLGTGVEITADPPGGS